MRGIFEAEFIARDYVDDDERDWKKQKRAAEKKLKADEEKRIMAIKAMELKKDRVGQTGMLGALQDMAKVLVAEERIRSARGDHSNTSDSDDDNAKKSSMYFAKQKKM